MCRGKQITLYLSQDFRYWKKFSVIHINNENINAKILIVEVQFIKEGIFVVYAENYKNENKIEQFDLYGLLIDSKNLKTILWKSNKAIYKTNNSKSALFELFGAVIFDDYLVSYWNDNVDGKVYAIKHFYKYKFDIKKKKEQQEHNRKNENVKFKLKRFELNPIIKPQNGEKHAWETQATYNPTAFESEGIIYIIYRADGEDMMSVWGYASTVDGITIENRLSNYIYQRKASSVKMQFPPSILYTSGNNEGGGCEDPRAVLIDGIIYVTFTAFDGWSSVRIGLTSISIKDFKNKNWNWKKTKLISPPGEINKNWVIFPEKINGKFAIMHSFTPNILIDYFDNLNTLDGKHFIKSNNKRPVDISREWDSWFRGVGPAPLKTKDGWLVFYHAMDHNNPDRYRLGALLLDLENPTKELYRSKFPILEPEKEYENNGHKWGVVYSCGAVIKDEKVFVYYGGADKFVCVAMAQLDELLESLKQNKDFKMTIN